MSALVGKQWLLLRCLAKLIVWADANGYVLTGKELLRTQAQAAANAASGAGIAHSLHLKGLAIDLALFKDGALLQSLEDWRPLGAYWKSLDPLCCWGGDFASRPDADHFSITDQGVR